MHGDLIYDVGMNNGDDTAYYLHCGYRVVAVEANPTLADQARRRFRRELASGALTLLNVGVAEEPGDAAFWVCETHSDWSSFHRTVASRDGSPHHAVTVPCRTFRSVLEEFGTPYYLKVDIEGNDGLCLRDLAPGRLPKYTSVEASDLGLLFRLRDLGYTRFQCISQFHYLPLEWPPSRRQRRYEAALRLSRSRNLLVRAVRRLGARRWLERRLSQPRTCGGWTFPVGSSGPFGEDLPGRWQTADELAETYVRFQGMMKERKPSAFWNEKDYSFWTDFHARRDG